MFRKQFSQSYQLDTNFLRLSIDGNVFHDVQRNKKESNFFDWQFGKKELRDLFNLQAACLSLLLVNAGY